MKNSKPMGNLELSNLP
jgi:hypothetical protein